LKKGRAIFSTRKRAVELSQGKKEKETRGNLIATEGRDRQEKHRNIFFGERKKGIRSRVSGRKKAPSSGKRKRPGRCLSEKKRSFDFAHRKESREKKRILLKWIPREGGIIIERTKKSDLFARGGALRKKRKSTGGTSSP